MQLLQAIIALFTLCHIGRTEAKRQCAKVKANLECANGEILTGRANATLWDEDRWRRDDLIEATQEELLLPNTVLLRGCASDFIGPIDPILEVVYRCTAGGQPRTHTVKLSMKCLSEDGCEVDIHLT